MMLPELPIVRDPAARQGTDALTMSALRTISKPLRVQRQGLDMRMEQRADGRNGSSRVERT